jgi:hypothetical protein
LFGRDEGVDNARICLQQQKINIIDSEQKTVGVIGGVGMVAMLHHS